MRPLTSSLENRVDEYDRMNEILQQHQFTLGGNWEYDHGYFDRYMEDGHLVWLRIPFVVTSGQLNGESAAGPDTTIRIGTPFVLKHVYNEGLDSEAEPHVYTAFFDQFQDPIDKDASIEEHWVKEGQSILRHVEQAMG